MTPQIRTMVVGVDSVREPDPVLRPAIELAERLGATLYVVHGYMLSDPLLDAYARAGYLGESTIVNFGNDLQSALEAQLAELTAADTVHARAAAGAPVSAILDVAREVGADLIVVGATRHGRFAQSLLGSTCRSIVRRSPLPVLMMRPGVAVAPRRLLGPTDLSPLSATALRWGSAILGVGDSTAEIRLLLVISESLLMLPLEQRLLDDVAEQELETFARSAVIDTEPANRIVRKGDPATEIVTEAKNWEADLVVLGTHSRKGMERLLLGSVAESTLRSAPCNVLVVPPN